MQEDNESCAKKVNKKLSSLKMSKNQNVPINSSSLPEEFREPQNIHLDTSDSDEESVSEESFPQDNDDISTEEFPEDESCESENDQDDVSEDDDEDDDDDDDDDDEDEESVEDNSVEDSDSADDRHINTTKKFLLNMDEDEKIHLSKQTKIDAILEAASSSKEKKGNPVLRNATAALDEAAQTITRMRSDSSPRDKNLLSRTLIAACTDNDVNAVRRLLVEGNNLNDTDDGDSLLSLACSAGYYELAQVLLAMSAQVEDRGQKNDCTPLMEAASAGHLEIIELLIRHGADVNAQSSTGNTPLMYACAGGHVDAVKSLLLHGANVEDHNENGHTPLMEAASAGHVPVAKILLEHGAGINTHSNEFKESALTLACYKGHLDMVRFLLEAGADQEHKTDEMHTALMEASMDGHVEVARLLLDSGAQVNMPTDSFESPLTLAACGGHVDLAMLLIERGANIEEVNDEGYTPLMEAAREGHEEMVSLLLTQGANINAQTEETQETALTLACCGGFLEVADYLIKHGADIELGASTPLMEAAQEGHLELVKFLLENKADVHAQTQTGDTALTYACENGHTDVAEILLYFGAELEHLSEGGRTPLMKACRAGHICTVKFLIQKGADVNRQTSNNDHTPLSLACAGGHQQVVELLLAHGADPYHKLKDNSTMLIEAAKGGHTGVVQLLLDYPTSIPQQSQSLYNITNQPTLSHQAAQMNVAQQQIKQQQLKMLQQHQQVIVSPPGLHEVSEVIRLQDPPGMFQSSNDMLHNQSFILDQNIITPQTSDSSVVSQMKLLQSTGFKDGLAYGLTKGQSAVTQMINQQTNNNMNIVSCNTQQQHHHHTQQQQQQQQPHYQQVQQLVANSNPCSTISSNKQKNVSRKKCSSSSQNENQMSNMVDGRTIAAMIPEDDNIKYIKSSLDKMDSTLQKNIQFINDSGPPSTLLPCPTGTFVDITTAAASTQSKNVNVVSNIQVQNNQMTNYNKTTPITAKSEVSQSTAISDRPKAKAKNSRKHQQPQQSGTTNLPHISLNDVNKNCKIVNNSITGDRDDAHCLRNSNTNSQIACPQDKMIAFQPRSMEEKDKVVSDKNRTCSLVDFEAFQKMPLNNLSNRSAHWDPKVFRKIAQLIDPPKSPIETPPPESPNHNIHSTLSEERKLESDLKSLLEEAMQTGTKVKNIEKNQQNIEEGLEMEKTFASLQVNANELVCDDINYEADAIESFTHDDVAAAINNAGVDTTGPIYNYEWVDEVMQALNVSPDISNAFHEIAANINNQDLEQYANFFGLNSICKSKWTAPHWPSHQMSSENTSPTNINDHEDTIVEDGNDSSLLMIDHQTGYPTQFTVEQLQLLSQLQQQHPLLQIDPQTAQNILMPAGSNFQVPPPPIISGQQKSIDDNSQQTKFVFNVDGEKTQSLQLLFQLPHDEQQQHQLIQSQHMQRTPIDSNQKIQQNAAQTQTIPMTTSPANITAQPIQLPQIVNHHHQDFLNFQLQQQQQQSGVQLSQQFSLNSIQHQQKIQQIPHHVNKVNYQQVQAATQTQVIGTQTHTYPTGDIIPQQIIQPIGKTSNLQANVSSKKTSNDQKRKEKSRYSLRQMGSNHNQFQYDQQIQYTNIPGSTSTGSTGDRLIEIDSETDSNHDTALTLACAGGHEELVELLLSRKANIEHRDKKGFTPLILAATAGHEKVVETLINTGADLEAQSERTKDTPLSLACSGGRYEVVELLLRFGANKEHRNVSDYTPLSLAASGGYVNIIKLLLNHGAEINSRTGSKLGISPLMLAAMNGHTAAVRLLLDMGSDINAQIETNRNTALTLACFQGRHEVVSLLLDRKANVEHRAKTGLTPLMEAASGGYIEVGRVLLDKGADVNAAPVPSSRDTALTIAADKGHLKFVELLLSRGASVEVKNKKGNSPLWLAANGGHLGVIEVLYHAKADIDSQDNRKVSCLMAAFRKGHVKVVKWMVNHVAQFPSDQEMTRYISVVEKEVIDKCHECVKIIRAAKETQAAKANINASILLKELDMEKSREDARKAAAAKRRERKKRRKQEKRDAQRKANGEIIGENKQNSIGSRNKNQQKQQLDDPDDSPDDSDEEESNEEDVVNEIIHDREEGDSGIDQGSCSSSDVKGNISLNQQVENVNNSSTSQQQKSRNRNKKNQENDLSAKPKVNNNNNNINNTNRLLSSPTSSIQKSEPKKYPREEAKKIRDHKSQKSTDNVTLNKPTKPIEKENIIPKQRENKSSDNVKSQHRKSITYGSSRQTVQGVDDYEIDFFKTTIITSSTAASSKAKIAVSPVKSSTVSMTSNTTPKSHFRLGIEDEWKEVGRKPAITATTSTSLTASSEIGCKKIQVPLNAISRVIGRGGSNINAIRAATGAHIEVEKQGKTQGDRSITIKGVPEATKQAHNLISTLVKDPDADILSMLPRTNFHPVRSSSSNNVMSPSSIVVVNNGTSVWEKSLNTIPTVTNPVKPASYQHATPLKTATPSTKSSTPTQLNNNNSNSKNNRSTIVKNLFSSTNTAVVNTCTISNSNNLQTNSLINSKVSFPSDSSSNKSLTVINTHQKIASATSPTSLHQNSKNINCQSITNANTASSSTFASKLGSCNDSSLTNEEKQIGTHLSQSPGTGKSNLNCFTKSLSNQIIQEVPVSISTPTTLTRSVTPIGLTARNIGASSNSSHIVNTLDLSTPYKNSSGADITTQIQSKLGELHVSAQGHEYSLFDNCKKWPQQEIGFHNPLNISAPYIESEPPVQIDVSKAPGYRGASINSPISSKTSSNSATPPSAPTTNSSVSQTSNDSFRDLNIVKPIGQGSLGPVQRPNLSSNLNKLETSSNFPAKTSGVLYEGYSSSDVSSYGAMNFSGMNPAASSMSRLNPKASAFSSVNMQNKMNPNIYNSTFMANINNNFVKPVGGTTSQQNPQRSSRWLGDLGHSFIGQSNDFTGSSLSMSPNNNSVNVSINNSMDDRKAPRPIGTERHNFKYNCFQYPINQLQPSGGINPIELDGTVMNQVGPNSWLDKQQWQNQSNVTMIPRNPYESTSTDYNMIPDLFPQQYPIDVNYSNRNGQGIPYHQNLYPNDLSNISTDLQQSYEKQPWTTKWTH